MSSFHHSQSGRTIYVGGGIPGRSAYEEAVFLGLFEGSPEEFILWLQGPPGVGLTGPAGPPARFLPPVGTDAERPAAAEDNELVVVEETGRVWLWRDGTWAFSMPWAGPRGEGGAADLTEVLSLLANKANAADVAQAASDLAALAAVVAGKADTSALGTAAFANVQVPGAPRDCPSAAGVVPLNFTDGEAATTTTENVTSIVVSGLAIYGREVWAVHFGANHTVTFPSTWKVPMSVNPVYAGIGGTTVYFTIYRASETVYHVTVGEALTAVA